MRQKPAQERRIRGIQYLNKTTEFFLKICSYTEKICPVKSVELSLGILDGYQNVVKIENLLL